MTTHVTELLPCPFCGSTEIDPTGWASTETAGPACEDCGASAGDIKGTVEHNVAAWNRRSLSSDSVSDGSKGVRVKPLTWKANGTTSLWTGELLFGAYYTAYDEGDGWRSFREQFFSGSSAEIAFGDKASVLSAAEADYRQRILSALDSGTGGQEPVAQGRDDLDEWIIGELSNAKALSTDGMCVMTSTATVLRAVRQALSVVASLQPKAVTITDEMVEAYAKTTGGLIVTEDKPTHAPEARAVTDLSRAQAEINRLVKWKDELLRAEKTQRLARESAEADLARAREALEFYANPKTYQEQSREAWREENPTKDPTVAMRCGRFSVEANPGFVIAPIHHDGQGNRARAALTPR